VRYPQYLAGVLMSLALALIAKHWLVAILGAVAAITYYVGAVCEEQEPIKKFGRAYRYCMEAVPRMSFIWGSSGRCAVTRREKDKEVGMHMTILVPLDGSERAEAILPHVEQVTRMCGAEVILLQVLEPPPYKVVSEQGGMTLHQRQLEHLEQQAQDYLGGLKDEFQEKGIEARLCIAHGSVVESILSTARSEEATVIAMASHGRSGLGHVLFGSVAARVLQRADRPLLLIRSREGE
jgi:nucleotide-binding universal stress UspA family protein